MKQLLRFDSSHAVVVVGSHVTVQNLTANFERTSRFVCRPSGVVTVFERKLPDAVVYFAGSLGEQGVRSIGPQPVSPGGRYPREASNRVT